MTSRCGKSASPGTRARCVICGRTLPRGRSKYCCSKCAQVANARKCLDRYHEVHPKVQRYCPVCGKELSRGMRRYCSKPCARRARLAYRIDYMRKYNMLKKRALDVQG